MILSKLEHWKNRIFRFNLQLVGHNVDAYDGNLIKHILYRAKNIWNVYLNFSHFLQYRFRTFHGTYRTQNTICKSCNIHTGVFYILHFSPINIHKYTVTRMNSYFWRIYIRLYYCISLLHKNTSCLKSGCWDLPSPLSVLCVTWIRRWNSTCVNPCLLKAPLNLKQFKLFYFVLTD